MSKKDYTDKPGFTFPGPPPEEALAFFRAKGIKPGFDYRDVWREEHATAFTVAKAMQLDVLTDIRNTLEQALAEGKTFAQFKKELTPLLQKKGWWGKQAMTDPKTGEVIDAQLGSPRRLKTIYDVNLRTARAAGQWQRIQRVKNVRPYMMYVIGPSKDHRDEHLQWHGTVLPVDDPWWDTHMPINGYGCKCGVRSLTANQLDRLKQQGIPDPTAPPIRDSKGNLTGRREQRSMPISTERPPLNNKAWLNKRTGESLQVPEGITPGFDSNPGQIGRQVHSARVFGTKLQTAPADIGAQAMVSASEFVKSGLAHDYQRWITPLYHHQRSHQGETQLVGVLKPELINQLTTKGIALESAAITLKDVDVQHLARDSKRQRVRDQQTIDHVLPLEDVLKLPEHLERPNAILRDKRDQSLVYLFELGDGDFGKIVIRPAYRDKVRLEGQREKITTSSIRTASKVEKQNLSTGEYDVLWGSLP